MLRAKLWNDIDMPRLNNHISIPLREDREGILRVGHSPVTLDLVIGAWKLGESPESIQRSFNTLRLADIYAVITFYLQHEKEVEEYLNTRAEAATENHQRNSAPYVSGASKSTLLARREEMEKAKKQAIAASRG